MRRIGRIGVGVTLGLGLLAGLGTPARANWMPATCGLTRALGPTSRETRVECDQGRYVVGLLVRGGLYVNQVGIQCAGFGPNGRQSTLRQPWRYAPFSVGEPPGTHATAARCDSDEAVASISMRSGIFVDRIQFGGCHRRVPSGSFVSERTGQAKLYIGGSGGAPCLLSCPRGEALSGIEVWHGSWVDNMRIRCSK